MAAPRLPVRRGPAQLATTDGDGGHNCTGLVAGIAGSPIAAAINSQPQAEPARGGDDRSPSRGLVAAVSLEA